MVISLESQNVRIKRNNNIKFKLPGMLNISGIDLPPPKININNISFVTALFIFSIFFSSGYGIFLPIFPRKIDIKAVELPGHGADVISKDMIAAYNFKKIDSFYKEYNFSYGDNLSNIAISSGVTCESILHINNISDINSIKPGLTLKIPVTDGYLHKVSSRDTLEELSLQYGVSSDDIFRINGLKSDIISELDTLFIPGVDPLEWGWRSNLHRYFIYPINGYISKRYGYFTNEITGITSMHEGLNFSTIDDYRVFASRGGVVSRIGYNSNYGNYLYIDHSGGTRTLYANLDQIYVSVRENLSQGSEIGTIEYDSEGNGKQLFFSILYSDKIVDPEKYLK